MRRRTRRGAVRLSLDRHHGVTFSHPSASRSPAGHQVDGETEGVTVELPLRVQLEAGRDFADMGHTRRVQSLRDAVGAVPRFQRPKAYPPDHRPIGVVREAPAHILE